jgi:hypothetical protein
MKFDPVVVARMAQLKLAWGVQFAVAEAVQRGSVSWQQVNTVLAHSDGQNNLEKHEDAATFMLQGFSNQQLGDVCPVLSNLALL